MLDFMRRNTKSFALKVAFGIIALTMIFFLGGGGGLMGSGPPLATIGSEKITLPEFQFAQSRNEAYFRDQFGGTLTADIRRALDIPGMTLRQLVDAAVLRQEADRLGLRIPDEAVASAIREIDAFHNQGSFSPARYQQVLNAQGLRAGKFETQMRNELLTNQLTELVKAGVDVHEDEAWEVFQDENRKLVLDFIRVPGTKFADEITVDEDDLAAYFDENIEGYRIPESVKVRYLAYTAEAFADQDKVEDYMIAEEYELSLESDYTRKEEITARHILLKVPEDADDEAKEAIHQEMMVIIARLELGEEFGELAKEKSEDVGSGSKGGDLGSFGRGRMVPPFEKAAFALEVGGRSEIVESNFGYHLIEVTAKQEEGPMPLEEVRERIEKKIALRLAKEEIFNAAAADGATIMDGTKLDVIADERGLSIEETPLFSKGDIVPGLGSAPAFVDAATGLGVVGDSSDAIKVRDNYYILQLAGREDSHLPLLDLVREDVEKAYRAARGAEKARDYADSLVTTLRGGKALAEVAESEEVEVESTDAFAKVGDFVPGLGNINGLKDAAFATSADGEALQRSFTNPSGAFVFVRKSLEEPDRSTFSLEKDDRIVRMRTAREQEIVGEFVRSLKERADITYNESLVRQLAGSDVPQS
jgi:peptidyl-prolyl cis-trans isomerase D